MLNNMCIDFIRIYLGMELTVIHSGNMQIIPTFWIMVVDLIVLVQSETIIIYCKVHNLFLSFTEIIQ